MILQQPIEKIISKRISPNLSTWQTIELSYQCAKYAIDNKIRGSFVECGVAAGNNLAAMCLAECDRINSLPPHKRNHTRMGYGFDSFEGIPWAGPNDSDQPGVGEKDESKYGELKSSGISSYGELSVGQNINQWNVWNYTLIKGWFQDTVKTWTGNICVLRLDGDLYESTLVCLNYLYRWLSIGGILIIDDWQLPGCRKAFEDFFSSTEKPVLIFDNGVTYWMK